MDKSLRKQLHENRDNVVKQYQLAGITLSSVKDYVLREMAIAAKESDNEACYVLLGMVYSISESDIKTDTLNNLLIMPHHFLHQAITFVLERPIPRFA
jgi:hypothetical protein